WSRSSSRCSKLISDRATERERIHQPSEHHRGGEKGAEHHRGGPDLLTPLVLQQRGEHDRHEQRVDDHEEKVARRNGRQHHFLPCAMSNASRIARKFSRPDVIRNGLPYSYDAAVTVPAPASARCAMTYGSPMPPFAHAPRNTSGSDHSSGKIRPCSHRPNANMSGSVTRNTTPLSRRPCSRCPAPGTSQASAQTSASRQGSAAARGRSAVVDFVAMPIPVILHYASEVRRPASDVRFGSTPRISLSTSHAAVKPSGTAAAKRATLDNGKRPAYSRGHVRSVGIAARPSASRARAPASDQAKASATGAAIAAPTYRPVQRAHTGS